MRFLLLALALAASLASAQDAQYAVYASQADLADGGTLPGALPTCLAVSGGTYTGLPPSLVHFIDRASGALATYNPDAAPGSRTTILATAQALAVAAGEPVTGCLDADGAVVSPDGSAVRVLYLALATSSGSVVLRRDATGALTRLTNPADPADAGRGVMGLAYGVVPRSGQLPTPVVYLARSRAAGAPENGLYTLDPATSNQTPAVLALAPNADPVGITFQEGVDRVVLVSSSNGIGEFRNALLGVAASALVVAQRPCGNSSTCALGDAETDYVPDGDIALPYAILLERDTEDRVLSNQGEVFFTESGLVSATGIAGFAPAGRNGYLAVSTRQLAPGRSTLLIAGSNEGGATPGIYAAAARLAVAEEDGPSQGEVARLAIYPNPTVSRGTIRISVEGPAAGASVSIYDALGRRVATLHDGPLAAGPSAFAVDTSALSAGVYTVRFASAAAVATARLVIAR